MKKFLRGRIYFRSSGMSKRSSDYQVEGTFRAGVGPTVSVSRLEELQSHFHHDLTIERLPSGDMRITRDIIANGPESAYRRATDLKTALRRYLWLEIEVVCPKVA